ncbi:MAG TPA: TonB-dependent receptor plug domain-containing protein, partial [Candidatus Eisenbacteria bacterium]|nr:TonB-dependent receptor plug domain-containing protein [Candidatus Eisenbacteria bacterium]
MTRSAQFKASNAKRLKLNSALRPRHTSSPFAFRRPALPLLATLMGVGASVAVADDISTNAPTRLPEVVVTATRSPQDAEQTGVTVSVVTREEMDAKNIHSLADALQSVPGLSVVQSGTPGQITSVFVRGTESNHTLLAVDGRRVTPALAGGFFYENYTLDNVDRIEIVRSPSSVLYGADSIGGVINIITKSGRGLEKPEYEASFEGGSFNTFRESAGTRGAIGKFDYAISASQFSADFPRDNNDFRQTSVRGSVGYEVSKELYFDLKGSYFTADGGSPGTIVFPDPIATLQREVGSISPGVTWKPNEKFESKLFYSFEDQYQRYRDQFGTDNKLKMDSHQIDWQNNLAVLDTWDLTAGLGFQDMSISQRNAAGVE